MTNEEQKQPTPAKPGFASKLKRASTAAPKDVVNASAASVMEEAKAQPSNQALTKTPSRPAKSTKPNKTQIIEANSKKPRRNLSRISKYLHWLIYSFLKVKEVFRLSAVSRQLLQSSRDNQVWSTFYPN
jgi:hypothetical protein